MHHAILRLAVPSIISNITVPLLGLVDITIVGHMGGTDYIGAIAVGGTLMSMMYWVLGFLRPGTGGLTAQAYGAGRHDECRLLLLRSGVLSSLLSLGVLALQSLVATGGLWSISPPDGVARLARRYFDILVWGAPAVLGLYALQGWMLGMQNARFPMIIAVVQNLVNISGSLAFVGLFGWRIEGVAAGTLLAQYVGLAMGIVFSRRMLRHDASNNQLFRHIPLRRIMDGAALRRFLGVNRDIFVRTLCLVAVTVSFTALGARLGSEILGANALLMQFFILFSYVMDGFAYAGEALGGKYYGAGRREDFLRLTRHLMLWGGGLTIAFTIIYIIGGDALLSILTDQDEVHRRAAALLPAAWLLPAAGVTAFVMDGLFIGATYTRGMLLSMAAAVATYFGLLALIPLTNRGMWMAFLVYLALRGGIQALLYPRCLPREAEKA